ncbi:MAG: ribonuclease HI [Desulfovibrio sp.]|nr:ribonuclease HI [Desulfovibrio sp.]
MKHVSIYTDGSCLGNPGPGGWAAILVLTGTEHRKEIGGGFRKTTNNRMEILGAVKGLEALKETCEVDVYTDSRYLRDAIEEGWLATWRDRGWRKADKKPLPNVDLWKRLIVLLTRHETTFHWVRGHNGHPENERCDAIAREWAARPDLDADDGYEKRGDETLLTLP